MCASCAWITFSCLMRVSSDFMMPSWFVIVLVFRFRGGTSARVVAMTLLGVAEKDVERLFGREVVVFGFVEVPNFGPASRCGVFFHVKSIGEMGLKVKRFFSGGSNRRDYAPSLRAD